MSKINVILVDDHKLIRNGLKSIINTTHNIDIVADFNNGKELIDYLKKNASEIDVILMDITMPIMSGITATEIINKLYPNIKILALTMHADEAYIVKMIDAGALGYILKDTERDILIEAIETVYHNDKYYSNEVSLKLIDLLTSKKNKKNHELTARELQILKFITLGSTNKEIGKKLNVSARTVESHRRNIIKKLRIKSTAEMVKYALANKII